MANAFSLKSYYNPHISPSANSFWGVISIAANEAPQGTDVVVSLICDVSGSMQGAKYKAMIATLTSLLKTAPDGIILNVVMFHDESFEVLAPTRLDPHLQRDNLVNRLLHDIDRHKLFGGTRMSTGINQALEAQKYVPAGAARYGIFLTDGQNVEPESQLAAAVKEAAKQQVHLCAYGFGSDWDPKQLTLIAEITKGWMPKAVPDPKDLQKEFTTLVARLAQTVATDAALKLWTPAGTRILSLSQAYPHWVKGEAAPQGDDHTWFVPVPPMSSKDHRDFVVHIELANVGARLVACKPSMVYAAASQTIEEKGDQSTWIILQQTNDTSLTNQVDPVVAGYLGQGQLAASTKAMTEAFDAGDLKAAERHRTEALEIARSIGSTKMTERLEAVGKGDEVARKTAALPPETESLTE
jgi:uncharacterized protein YegL